MKTHLNNVCRLLAVAAFIAGCASPGYNPPDGPRAVDTCPLGEIWVCRDHYPSRLGNPEDRQLTCMCQDLTRVR